MQDPDSHISMRIPILVVMRIIADPDPACHADHCRFGSAMNEAKF